LVVQVFQKSSKSSRWVGYLGAFGDESSTPLCLHEEPLLCKDPQGFPNRDSADSKFAAQFTFGGKLGSGRIFAPSDTLSNRVLDLIVEGCDPLITLKHGETL